MRNEMEKRYGRLQGILRGVLLAFCFSLPITIAVAEPLAYLLVFLWVISVVRDGRLWGALKSCVLVIPVAVFALLAVAASALGPRPEVSLEHCHRLILLGCIPAVAYIISAVEDGGETADRAFRAFVLGAVLLGLYDIVRVPIEVHGGVKLYETGNMRDPQFYMTAVLFVGAALASGRGRLKSVWGVAMLVCCAGLILHFKRGVWVASLIGAGAMAPVFRRARRIVLILLLIAVGSTLFAPVRHRWAQVREQWGTSYGGRYVLWTRVAPVILRRYPWGMGLGAPRNADFRRIAPGVQRKLSHLHNNVLEIALETGWPGVGAWMLMIGLAGYLLFRRCRPPGKEGDTTRLWVPVGAWGAFIGLLANGMVEYNFGDSEIFMLMIFLMGVACARQADSHGGPGFLGLEIQARGPIAKGPDGR